MLHKYESENKKISELNRLLKIQMKNIEGKALNFSSKLIMVEVQLGIEKDKNHKLLHTLEQLKTEKVDFDAIETRLGVDHKFICSEAIHTTPIKLILKSFRGSFNS